MEEGKRGTIFVFGSNLAGRHGAGSALHARMYKGAIYGRGIGRQGNSYAIPTKDYDVYTTLPIERIKQYVEDFIEYAKQHPELQFRVSSVGTGKAGYTDEQMAPLFKDAPSNCVFSASWRRIIQEARQSSAGQDLDGVASVQQA